MKLLVLRVERSGARWAEAACKDYGRRLRRFGGIDERVIRPERFRGDAAAVRAAEGERILAALRERDWLVAVDERGEALDGAGLVHLLRRARQRAPGRLVFALGGPYGHAPAVRERAWRVLRLSSLVLNHRVARVVLMEQLYRAHADLHGIPYSH